MKLIKEERKINAKAVFGRGFISDNTSWEGLYNLHIRAVEDYDYHNWTKEDLQDLADALNAFLKEVQSKRSKRT